MEIALKRREFLAGVAATSLLSACRAGSSGAMGGSLKATLDDIGEELLAEYPQNATILGIATGERAPLVRQWQDQTLEGVAARKAAIGERLATLQGLDLADLSDPSKLDGAVALQAHEIAAKGYDFPFGDPLVLDPYNGFRNTPYVVNQLGNAYIDMPDFLDGRFVIETAEDAEAFADLVDVYARNLDGETERMRHDRGIGVVAPDFVLDRTIAVIANGANEKADSSGVVATFAKKMAEAGLTDEALSARVSAAMGGKVIPALQRQLEELNRHRSVATKEAGTPHFKDGDAYYAWALKAGTTTDLSPEEIHRQGEEQVRIIQSRMDEILKKQGLSGGTVGERMAALGERPDQLYANTDAGRAKLLDDLNAQVDHIRALMPQAFATLVPGNLVVKRVPPAIEAGAPGGYAAAGSIDGKVPGAYYINLRDTAEWPKFSLPTLTYHEGIPGHIWQGEYSNRLPLIRSMLAFNAFSEGWALYAEQLADELGVYEDDPFGQLGYLQSQSFRACRLVVDTGLHAMGWSREQAIDWFVKTNGDARSSVEGEVDRYCAMPGQACGYMIGRLEILRLREKAKKAMGDRYDLRTFNDAVVVGGAVPMTLLEAVIDNYVAG